MSTTATQSPRFPWDYDVPNSDFWTSLDYRVARNFLTCYSESEIAELSPRFDSSLSETGKLKLLRQILQDTLAAQESQVAPGRMSEQEPDKWQALMVGLSTMEHFTGNYAAEESILRVMISEGRKSTRMSALHTLSGVLEITGRYVEAEAAAREVLPFFLQHEWLGEGSPQVLGCQKTLVRAVWKQEKFDDAEAWVKECRVTLEVMGQGKFAKYQQDEIDEFEQQMKDLKEWRDSGGGGGSSFA